MERTFLCLGAGPGMGLATALKFAGEGFRVVLAARNGERLAALATEIKARTGRPVETARVDVGQYAQVRALKDAVGDVAVLHFNAAIVHAKTLAEEAPANIAEDITVGITGALYALKTFAPAMLAGRSGTILLTGGILALHPLSAYLTLGIAKAGIRNLTEALFDDFRQGGVHIACVTVGAAVAPHSAEAADVAELFWKIHCQPRDRWTWNEDYFGKEC